MQSQDEMSFDAAISCYPERGWVAVQVDSAVELEHPIFELRVVSAQNEPIASTLVMDAPESFRVTLHLRGVDLGTRLWLQVQLISAEDAAVRRVGEFPFVYEAV